MYEHKVPKLSEKKMNLLLESSSKPVFSQMGKYLSGVIVGRRASTNIQKNRFTGLEHLFVPNLSLLHIAAANPPRAKMVIGDIYINKIIPPSDMTSKKIPIGSLFLKKELYNEWIHVWPQKSLVYDPKTKLVHSVIFGFCDEFGTCSRIWSTNNNYDYIQSLSILVIIRHP